MQQNEMLKEEILTICTREVVSLKHKIERLQTSKKNLTEKYGAYGPDRWYIAYLQTELSKLEILYDNLQDDYDKLAARNAANEFILQHYGR